MRQHSLLKTDFNKQEYMAAAKEQLGKHITMAMDMHATIEYCWKWFS
jgi:hypothetical protein